jgi:arsenate reductase
MIYYGYRNCSTCRNALKWLRQQGIDVKLREIRETPPSPDELAYALKALQGDRKRLLNVAGAEYRSMGLKNLIDGMNDDEVFAVIQSCGNLCKRPLLIDKARGKVLVGFDPEIWRRTLVSHPASDP